MRSRHVSVVIHRPPDAVDDLAADPGNLTRWAAGLASAEVRREGEVLVAESPMGPVRIAFVARNPYGVLDHDVTTPDGTTRTTRCGSSPTPRAPRSSSPRGSWP